LKAKADKTIREYQVEPQAQRGGAPADPTANLASYQWLKHCDGLFQMFAAA
jgi:hypothetical protein